MTQQLSQKPNTSSNNTKSGATEALQKAISNIPDKISYITQMTSDYSMFKKHPSNTPINETIVEKLMESIQQNNLLPLKPMLVNDKMQVLDGQHRLEAAKRLETPIYYVVKKDAVDMDMVLLNAAQRTWKLVDYHHFFVDQGWPEYKKLEEFIKKHKMTLPEYMKLDNYGRKSPNAHAFRKGRFVMPSDEQQAGKMKIWNLTKELIQFIARRRSDIPQVLKSVNFQRALVSFLKREDINLEEVRGKIEVKIDTIGARSGVGGYYSMFVEIYNFRRKEQIAG